MTPPVPTPTEENSERMSPPALSATQGVGLVAIVVIATLGVMGGWGPPHGDSWATFAGVLLIAGLLWLAASGYFGFATARRDDWVALLPFAVALLLREVLTLHSLQEIEIQFAFGPVGRHSVVYPLLQIFFLPIVADAHRFTMHMNGVLGAIACLGMYLFVRQRTNSRRAAFLCSWFLATHPLVTRFSPTDGPYALLLASWFCGLALLSAPVLSARAMIGGAALLGVAATTRMEGSIFLVASLLLLDLRQLLANVRRLPWATVTATLVIAAQGAVQMYFLLPVHMRGPTRLGDLLPPFDRLFIDAVWPGPYNHPLFMALVGLGAMAAISRRGRLGILAYAAMLLVLTPMVGSWRVSIALHRMIPTCALQTLVAGMGAYALASSIPWPRRRRWAAVLPGMLVATIVLLASWSELTRTHVFNEEYDLVRRHLAPGGRVQTQCTLLTLNMVAGADIDIHELDRIVPGMKTVDCRSIDCVAILSQPGCFYYVRSAASYFHRSGIPTTCMNPETQTLVSHQACLDASTLQLESAVQLQPIEVRTIELLETFPDRRDSYPITAEVGLFRASAANVPPPST